MRKKHILYIVGGFLGIALINLLLVSLGGPLQFLWGFGVLAGLLYVGVRVATSPAFNREVMRMIKDVLRELRR